MCSTTLGSSSGRVVEKGLYDIVGAYQYLSWFYETNMMEWGRKQLAIYLTVKRTL